MRQADVVLLLDYSYWATGLVLGAAATLSTDQFIAAPNSHTRSVRDTLLHILGAEQIWRTRMEAGVSPAPLSATDFPNMESLRQRWRDDEQAMRAYLSTLDDIALDGSYQYRRSSGAMSDALTRWQTLMHVVNHGTQHRSEAALLLTTLGCSPATSISVGSFTRGAENAARSVNPCAVRHLLAVETFRLSIQIHEFRIRTSISVVTRIAAPASARSVSVSDAGSYITRRHGRTQ